MQLYLLVYCFVNILIVNHKYNKLISTVQPFLIFLKRNSGQYSPSSLDSSNVYLYSSLKKIKKYPKSKQKKKRPGLGNLFFRTGKYPVLT